MSGAGAGNSSNSSSSSSSLINAPRRRTVFNSKQKYQPPSSVDGDGDGDEPSVVRYASMRKVLSSG